MRNWEEDLKWGLLILTIVKSRATIESLLTEGLSLRGRRSWNEADLKVLGELEEMVTSFLLIFNSDGEMHSKFNEFND